MFVRYYLELPVPFCRAEAGLLGSPSTWIPRLAERANTRGENLLAEVGFGPPGYRIKKKVEIALGEPFRLKDKMVLPLTWKATGPEHLFPDLEADLEVAGLGPDRSQFAISARYRPSLGRLGEVLDRALLHRVAEATLKGFLDEAGRALLGASWEVSSGPSSTQ